MRRHGLILILFITCIILVVSRGKIFERSDVRETLITSLNIGTEISSSADKKQNSSEFAVLIFSKTAEYRHRSIPAGISVIEAMGSTHNFRVEASEDATIFTNDRLANYQVVVFLSTTGDILNTAHNQRLCGLFRMEVALLESTRLPIRSMIARGTVSSWVLTSSTTQIFRQLPLML